MSVSGAGVADDQGPHVGDQRVDDDVGRAAGHEDAGLRRAHLAVVLQAGVEQLRDGGGEVGVVQHDARRLAAELEGAALHHLAAERTDLAARGGAPGERDLVHERVGDEVAAEVGVAGQDAHDSGWHIRVEEDLGEHEGAHGRLW